jgi:hypothetical protein
MLGVTHMGGDRFVPNGSIGSAGERFTITGASTA